MAVRCGHANDVAELTRDRRPGNDDDGQRSRRANRRLRSFQTPYCFLPLTPYRASSRGRKRGTPPVSRYHLIDVLLGTNPAVAERCHADPRPGRRKPTQSSARMRSRLSAHFYPVQLLVAEAGRAANVLSLHYVSPKPPCNVPQQVPSKLPRQPGTGHKRLQKPHAGIALRRRAADACRGVANLTQCAGKCPPWVKPPSPAPVNVACHSTL
jgi:hypothetical protein